jgi:hypothetical protein
MNKKRILEISLAIIFILLAGLAIWQWQTKKGSVTQPEGPSSSENFDPRNPNFTAGTFVQVIEYKPGQPAPVPGETRIWFKQGAVDAAAVVTAQTVFTKQVKKGEGIEVVASSLTDLKPNAQIVVYFHEAPKAQVYRADKIQIISQ